MSRAHNIEKARLPRSHKSGSLAMTRFSLHSSRQHFHQALVDLLLRGDAIQAGAGDGVGGETRCEAGSLPRVAGGVEPVEERGGEDVARAGAIDLLRLR